MQSRWRSKENHNTLLVIHVRLDRHSIHSQSLSRPREISTEEKLFAYAVEIRSFECLWSLSVYTPCGTLACTTFSTVKN